MDEIFDCIRALACESLISCFNSLDRFALAAEPRNVNSRRPQTVDRFDCCCIGGTARLASHHPRAERGTVSGNRPTFVRADCRVRRLILIMMQIIMGR